MSRLEKFLLAFISLAAIFRVFSAKIETSFNLNVLLAELIALVTIYIFYFITSGKSLFKFIFLLLIFTVLADLFQVLHLAGANVLSIVGFLGSFLALIYILKTAWDHPGAPYRIYLFVYVAVLAVSTIMLIVMPTKGNLILAFEPYLSVAIIATLKINKYSVNYIIDKYFNITLIGSIIYVVHAVAKLLF